MIFHTLPCVRGLLTLFLLGWLVGCTGSFEHVNLDPHGVGFQTTIPKAGTRVVVWGNHSSAVDEASTWLHRQGLTVLDRTRLQQGLNEQEARLTGSSKDWAHILKAGESVGADLVTFVEVSNIKGGQKFALSQVRSAPTFSLTVEIRGVKPGTGEIVTKSKAWQTGPAQDPDMLIEELTTRALGWAWKPGSTDLKVIADSKEEVPQEEDMMQIPPSTLAPQGSTSQESLGGNGSMNSVSLVDPDRENHEVANQEASLGQHPNSIIHANNASAYEELEITPIANPDSVLLQNARLNSQEGSDPKPESVVTVANTSPNGTGQHHEVDSTYLNELEPITASDQSSNSSSDEIGPQMASGALSILYTPAKLVYAGLGGLFGGLAYVLTGGDERAAGSIWASSLEGDYYLTPAHLRGDAPLQFMGPSSENPVVETHDSKEPFVEHSFSSKE